jgi:hypothetical protein
MFFNLLQKRIDGMLLYQIKLMYVKESIIAFLLKLHNSCL